MEYQLQAAQDYLYARDKSADEFLDNLAKKKIVYMCRKCETSSEISWCDVCGDLNLDEEFE